MIAIPIRGLGIKIYYSSKYVVIKFFIIGIPKGKLAIACLLYIIHVIENLKASILLDSNILIAEDIVLDFKNQILKT